MKWRVISLGVALALLSVAVLTHVHDLEALIQQGHHARRGWLTVALVAEILWFLNQVALYQSLYKLLDLPAPSRQLLPIVLGSNFVNFTTPSISLGGVPLFLQDAQKRGLDGGRVTLVSFLRLVLNLIWFSTLLSFTLIVLLRTGKLHPFEIAASAVLFSAAAVVVAGLIAAALYPATLGTLLARGTTPINRVGRRLGRCSLLREERARQVGTRFGGAVAAIRRGGTGLIQPCLHVMAYDALQVAVLYATLLALPGAGTPVSLVGLVVVYSIGVLFSVIAITPQGLGAAEAMMIMIFTGLGLAMSRAVDVVLLYRGFVFWLPLLVGFVALRWVRGAGRSTTADGTAG